MAATIQKILKPTKYRAVDTSGNNNHGQIYSGRALEFDGVSDYLDFGDTTFIDFSAQSTTAEKAWTVAAWINYDAVGTLRQNIIGANDNRAAGTIAISDSEKLYIYDHGGGVGREGNTILQPSTWYRAVWVFNGSDTVTFYLNGVADGTAAIGVSSDNYDLKFRYIGTWDPTNATPRIFAGKMSDLQAWQGAWSASDVTFDYLNPESLALNNGGTSLTESNLKLWYPMQDGHRGQQSYILDGANTGLSSVSYYGGSTVAFASWTAGSGWSVSNGIVTGSSTGDMFKNDSATALVDGVTYKATIVVDSYTSGDVKVYTGGSQVNFGVTAPGTYSVYITNATTNDIAAINGAAFSGSISSIEFYPVNDKHHATTAFYGDMTALFVDDASSPGSNDFGHLYNTANTKFDFTDESYAFETGGADWDVIANSAFTSDNIDGIIKTGNVAGLHLQNNSSAKGGIRSGAITTVAGRTYVLDIVHSPTSESWVTSDLYIDIGTSAGASDLVNATNSDGTYTVTFVATSTETHITLGPNSTTDDDDTRIQTLQFREQGTATGWTDADQQLDIPQTALQSYNQLAWFNGTDSKVVINPTTSIWNAYDEASADDRWNSISYWIYSNKYDNNTNNNTMHWGVQNGPSMYTAQSGSDIEVGVNTGNGEKLGISVAKETLEGKWSHWVWVWKGNDNANDTAMNQSTDADVYVYLNGERHVATYVQGTNSNDLDTLANSDLTLGTSHSASNYFFQGGITEVCSWKYKLTNAHVIELYNDGKAFNALNHSNISNLTGYWRNNGLATWTNLVNPGTNDGIVTCSETLLLPAGVDASRDNQGFLMNRQKTTNSLNLARVNSDPESSPFVIINPNPLYTGSVVTAASCSAWVKFLRFPEHTDKAHIFDARIADGDASFMLWMDASNVLQFRFYANNSGTFKYVHHDLDADEALVGYDASEEFLVNKWIHLSATFETLASDTNMHLYANAKLIGGGVNYYTDPWSLHAAGTSAVSIGANLTSSTTPAIDDEYVGNYVIDDALIYRDKALSADEITRNYNAGKRSHR